MTATVKRKFGRTRDTESSVMAEGHVAPFSFYDPATGLQLGFDVVVDQPPNKSIRVVLSRESACELSAGMG